MSRSGGAPNAGTQSRTAVIAGQGRSPNPPPPCPHCDHAPSDLSAAATPVALDLSALQAAADAANTFIETHQDLLARHQQAVRNLVAARRHNEELHAHGRPDWDTVRGFVNFAQHRYDVAQGRLRQAIQHEADAAQDNEKLRAELQSFGDLRTRHAVAEEVAEEAYTQLQDYAIGLENRLAHRADPSVPFAALPSVAQDLQDARDENKNLKQRLRDESSRLGQQITDLGHRLQTAQSDRDVALQDLFRLQKDYAEVRRHYDQWKSYGEERDREIRQLRKDLAETVPAADLQASRIEAHVRGQRIAELEKLLSKSESRRHKLHDVHDHVVAKLKKAEQETPDLKRQLYSSFR
jgi:chromosome segregation ATPase